MLQQFQAAMQIIQQAAMVDPMVGQMAMQAGLIAPEQMQAMAQQQASAPGGQPESSTPEERAARATAGGDNSQAAKARVRAANAALPR